MKVLVFLAGLIGAVVCYPWGIPQQVHDTPDVAAAKSAHLAAHAKARYATHSREAQEKSSSGHEVDGNIASWNCVNHDSDGAWKHYDDGSWKDDTQTWDHELSDESLGSLWEIHEKKWTGPIALPPGYDKHGAPLQVLDTAEVAAAKLAHLEAHNKARSYTNPSWKAQDRSRSSHESSSAEWESQSWNHRSSGSHWGGQEMKWTGPAALPPGYDKHGAPLPVQDTSEVVAAKSKHFNLYQHAAARSAPAHASLDYQN